MMKNDIPLNYTLCFIEHQDELLMLYRHKEPNANQWNGVGGKLEPSEAPLEAIRREIDEETGITPRALKALGVVTWNRVGGMYVFHAMSDTRVFMSCDEGKLAWKPKQWVYESPKVVTNIPIFLPVMLSETNQQWYFSFQYNEQGDIMSYSKEILRKPVC